MGTTKNNIVIGILVLIIAGLSVSLYRVTRLRRVLYEVSNKVPAKIPLDVFVTELSKSVERHNQVWHDVAAQNKWLRRHLEQTLSKLEAEYKLEPIPVKTFYPYSEKEHKLLSDFIGDPALFAIPYQKPEYPPPAVDPNGYGLMELSCRTNTDTDFFVMQIYDSEFWIENFYERLQRLEQTMQAAKK